MKIQRLDHLRNSIDIIDNSIIKLVRDRIKIIEQVGIHKKELNIPPLDKNRWDEVMQSRIEQGKNCGLSEILMRDIFEAIHREALIFIKKIEIFL